MTSPPPAPPSSTSQPDLYAHLLGYLQPSPLSILEIDILPSSACPTDQILYSPSPPSLALSKTLLVNLYLHARSIFFSTKADSQSRITRDNNDAYDAKLQATTILLLFDPNHITAANFRKKHIVSLNPSAATSCSSITPLISSRCGKHESRKQAIRRELYFLTSLVTSPLHKHAKSSTLWAQRLWLWREYKDVILEVKEEDGAMGDGKANSRVWEEELDAVMGAGERHPRNYYAWEYARQLFYNLPSPHDGFRDMPWYHDMLVEDLGKVHAWCLMHPRDISGWSFLAFLVQKALNEICQRKEAERSSGRMEREIRMVVWQTNEWARKYEWRGKSLEWFLKVAERAEDAMAVK